MRTFVILTATLMLYLYAAPSYAQTTCTSSGGVVTCFGGGQTATCIRTGNTVTCF
jgi:hypothetical protein